MKIDNKEIRKRLAVNAAKRTGDGPWQAICKDADEEVNLVYRKIIVALSRVSDDKLDALIAQFPTNPETSPHYNKFIRRYNKEYREIEASMESTVPTVKKADAVVTPLDDTEFTPAELKKLKALQKKLINDPTVAVFNEFAELILPWGGDKAERALRVLGPEAHSELVVLRGIKEKRVADMAAAREAITEKIPRSEIEAEKEGGWDIDVEIFYPISIGVVTGRLGPISEAIEVFGWAFDGRALPELTAIATILMIDKYEGNVTKLLTYYSSIVVALGKLSDSLAGVAAIAARKRMEALLGIEDVAGELMKTLSGAIIEEGV